MDNIPQKQKELIKIYLYKTQLLRKTPITQYIMSIKIVIALAISGFLMYSFGSGSVLYVGCATLYYVYNSYRKDTLNFTFKIDKKYKYTYYSLSAQLTKRIFVNYKELLSLERMYSYVFFVSLLDKKEKKKMALEMKKNKKNRGNAI